MIEKVNAHPAPLLEENGIKKKILGALLTEAMFQYVSERASGRGMVVNDRKTVMLCVSDAISFLSLIHI